jgi:excisionase family DNA binding protein
MSAGAVRGRPTPFPIASLPNIEDVAAVPVEQVPGMIVHLSALQVALATRLPAPAPPGSSAGTSGHLVTAKEVAVELTLTVPRVYELARTHHIPSVRIGRTLRFDVEAVRKALAS